MDDYISKKNIRDSLVLIRSCDYESALSIINNIPAADVQPVKHGEWIGVDYDTYFECSECKHMTDWQLYKYCPYCGADMREATKG